VFIIYTTNENSELDKKTLITGLRFLWVASLAGGSAVERGFALDELKIGTVRSCFHGQDILPCSFNERWKFLLHPPVHVVD